MSRMVRHLSCLAALGVMVAWLSGLSAQEKKSAPIFETKGELSNQDPFDKLRNKSYVKTHALKMSADKTYRIDLTSPEFDTLLRLENAEGQQLGLDDDGGGGTNSRLIFKAPKDGMYTIIVTTFPPGETGKYQVTVTEPSKADLLAARVRQFARLDKEERGKVMEEFFSHLEEQGKNISMADGQLAFQIGYGMEQSRTPGAGDLYTKLSKALAVADNERIQGLSKMMEGCARRMKLPGNTMDIKGTTLDGKKLDWASYRGKVVLVDFWATWCGPCIAELPNMKKMYDAYKGKGFDVVAISIDRNADAPTKFMERKELPWACLYEKDAKSQPLADQYGVMAIPLAILVDKEGKVISMNARGPELGRLLEQQLGPIPEAKTDDEKK